VLGLIFAEYHKGL